MGLFTDSWDDFSLKNTLLTLGITGIVLGGGIGGCNSCNNYDLSKGYRIGVINKISNKGFIWKTYEGQMALEGMVSNGKGTSANVWDFSIDAQARHGENIPQLAKKLDSLAQLGKKVKIEYIEAGCPLPWRGSTDYYIKSVEPLDKK
jgi:hypothetical protein